MWTVKGEGGLTANVIDYKTGEKTVYLKQSHVEKIRRLSVEANTSQSAVLCDAIESFDPDNFVDKEQVDLAAAHVKEALKDAQKIHARLGKTIDRVALKTQYKKPLFRRT